MVKLKLRMRSRVACLLLPQIYQMKINLTKKKRKTAAPTERQWEGRGKCVCTVHAKRRSDAHILHYEFILADCMRYACGKVYLRERSEIDGRGSGIGREERDGEREREGEAQQTLSSDIIKHRSIRHIIYF